MNTFENLNKQEHESLLEFPAYISLLAANADGEFDKAERGSAVDFEHIKTYSCDKQLAEFYAEVDKTFKSTIEEFDKALPMEKAGRDAVIKNKLMGLDKVLSKLGPDYASVMHRSMESFKEHVSQAHHNVLVDFIFPIPIKGLSY